MTLTVPLRATDFPIRTSLSRPAHSRITLCESEQIDKMVEAVTNYIAQRLIEREQALAADARALTRDEVSRVYVYEPAVPATPAPARRQRRFFVRLFVFFIDLLGI